MKAGVLLPISVLLISLALTATACGGDAETSSSPGTAVEATVTPEAPATTAPPASDSTSSDVAESQDAPADTQVDGDGLFPDVVAVKAHRNADGTYDFDVTLSSPYDSAERYADAWRISGPDGTVFGVRELAHDHASEQPFTRSLGGVDIPDGVTTVLVEGRDQVNGWGGTTLETELPTA